MKTQHGVPLGQLVKRQPSQQSLFDGIARDIKGLVAVAEQHRLNKDVTEHFVRECLPLEQGDAVRVSGAKRDDLQDAIALVKKSIADFPVQFGNFRD